MRKYFLIVISLFLLLVSACTPKNEGELSFIDETAENAEETGTSSVEPETVEFPTDCESSNSRFSIGSERIYLTTSQIHGSDDVFILEADPVNMTYRPLCRKPGCKHEDDSCYAYFRQTSAEEYCGWSLQGYDDGLYQYVIPKGAEDNAVMQLLKYDPLGKTAPSIAYEIPLEGLLHVSEGYEVYPQCCLHRGYAVITSEKQEESDPDLQEEEKSDSSEDEDYDPANPFNEIAKIRHDHTMYLSLYDLEKHTMIPVLEKTYPKNNMCWQRLNIVDDEIYVTVVMTNSRPITRTAENGESSYDLIQELAGLEIYRIALGDEPKPELLYEGKIPSVDQLGPVCFQDGSMLILNRISEDCEYGNRHDFVLMSLDFSTGAVRRLNTLFNGSEDAINDGANGYLSTAEFRDGYIFGRSYNEKTDFTDPISGYSGEQFIIFDMNGEREADFSFNVELPSPEESYYYGANICGFDSDSFYCNNSTEDQILLFRVPLNGSEVQYFTPAEGTGEEASAETEDAEEDPEEKAVDYSDEIYSDLDPTVSTFGGNAFAQDQEKLYVAIPIGEYGNARCLAAIDKATGKIRAFCSKDGCTHDNEHCEAYLRFNGITQAMTVTDRELLVAGFLDTSFSKFHIRGYDLETGKMSERATIDLSEAGIEKMNYAHQNSSCFFHRDAFYYYEVRSKQTAGGVLGFKDTEITALIYRYPLSGDQEGELILEQEINDADFCNLRVSAYGDKLLITTQTGFYQEGEAEGTVETTDNLFSVTAYDIQEKKFETLYEGAEHFFLMNMYPKQDALYMISGEQGSTSVKKLDYAAKTISDVGDAIKDEDYLVEFNVDGYFTLKKPGQYVDTDHLFVRLYDFEGNVIREFSYKMPEELLPPDAEKYPQSVGGYLGVDQWNIYFNDAFLSDTESVNLLYAVPLAGDAPVIFER